MTLVQSEEKATGLMKGINSIYNLALSGAPMQQSALDIANEFNSKYKSKESAINAFINWQIAKCTTTGFVTGLGGVLTLPLSIPADLASSIYIQLRMIAVIATMRGYDPKDEEVRTFAYLALCGSSASNVVKEFGIKFGVKYFGRAVFKKVSREMLVKINRAVGFRLVTKGGSKGLLNISKVIPVVGGVIGGGFNFVETKIIAKAAKHIFIDKE